ncbi:hypothetical protein B0H14DRAFT_3519028 [Mycena olivaceomarginata]|nr:hypothetical protein B0H14DRAFT_3519028 [Mycena olivaceomarginata]
MYARKHMPQTGPRAVLPLISCPSANLSFIDLAIAPRSIRANPRSIPRRLHAHLHGLHPSSSFYSPPSLSLHCYLASRRRLCNHSAPFPSLCCPSNSVPPTALSFYIAVIRCLTLLLPHCVSDSSHLYQYLIGASYPPSLSFLSVPAPPAWCVAGLDSSLLGVMDMNPIDPPPFFSSSRSRHGQHRSWVSAVGVSPRLPVASPYSPPYDLKLGTSFGARALPTAGASVNLTASPFVLSRTRIDSKITLLELRALATRLLSTRAASSFVPLRGTRPRRRHGSIANALRERYFGYRQPVFLISTPTSANSIFLVFGCPGLLWCVHAHRPTPTLTVDSAYLSSAPACARTLMPVIRTHDDDKSMCPR